MVCGQIGAITMVHRAVRADGTLPRIGHLTLHLLREQFTAMSNDRTGCGTHAV